MLVRAVPAIIAAAKPAFAEILFGQDHQAILEVEINALDELLGVFLIFHRELETPYYPRHPLLENR